MFYRFQGRCAVTLRRWIVLLGGGLIRVGLVAAAPPADELWQEVSQAELDTGALTERGRAVLALPDLNWKHAQTEHFVIHFEQAIFARKVARLAEFYYAYIGTELGRAPDTVVGRSHIFIFRRPEDWRAYLAATGSAPWVFSQVAGPAMYLQQADNIAESGAVLAHEMTHLVINRLVAGTPPLWLNEGLAEFYGEFAYAAFKGIKKSRRAQFRQLEEALPLTVVWTATEYPAAVGPFYQTAKYLVGFLLLEWPAERFAPFLRDLSQGGALPDALQRHYGFATPADFAQAFAAFCQ